MDEKRKQALAAALGQIERQFGKGTVMRMGDSAAARNIDVISTGSITLDVALGIVFVLFVMVHLENESRLSAIDLESRGGFQEASERHWHAICHRR